jgi:hypothetical protein
VSSNRTNFRIFRIGGLAAAVLFLVLVALLTAFGWLYLLRDAGWLGLGPKLSDSLPLLQLAGFDSQPMMRVLVAWVVAGVLVGVLLGRLGRAPRVLAAGVPALILLLLASQAAYALARNLRFTHILFSRTPGPGVWLEAACFAVGCALPRRDVTWRDWLARGVALGGAVRGLGHFGLSGGELGYAGEHEHDRQ